MPLNFFSLALPLSLYHLVFLPPFCQFATLFLSFAFHLSFFFCLSFCFLSPCLSSFLSTHSTYLSLHFFPSFLCIPLSLSFSFFFLLPSSRIANKLKHNVLYSDGAAKPAPLLVSLNVPCAFFANRTRAE